MHVIARRLLGAIVLTAVAGLAAGAVALAQDGEVVTITDELAPSRLEVSTGTIVTWRNEDDERHRVRSRQGPVEFDSGNLEPGERFSVTFVVAGEYPYLDERNDEDPAYFGMVVVVEDEPIGGPTAMEATVTLIDESFQPPAIEVATGATVTWQNIDGDDDHTVTADDGTFNSGVLAAGSAFEHTFESPGTFSYFCAIHPEMTGTITVTGEAVAPEDVTNETGETAEAGETGATDEAAAIDDAGEPADTSVSEGEPGPFEATIIDLTFQPSTVEIDAGASVTWTNEDSVPHTVTARTDDFNSGVLQQNASFTQTFDEPGVFDFFCAIHPSMSGTVVVGEATGGAAAGEPATDGASEVTSVDVVDVAFKPADIEVAAGTTVDWTNGDPFAHTVTATDGAFDSGNLAEGQSFSQTFDEPGTFDYFCEIHPSMTGTITVTP